MKKQTHKSITIFISEKLIQEVDKLAADNDRSRSWIIENILKDSPLIVINRN